MQTAYTLIIILLAPPIPRIELSTAVIELDERGYLWTRFRDGQSVELEDAVKHAEAIVQICEGRKRPFVVDGRQIYSTISHEAREYLARHKGVQEVRAAQAFLTDHLANRLVAKIFIYLHKPANPTRIFACEQEAVKWLSQFEAN